MRVLDLAVRRRFGTRLWNHSMEKVESQWPIQDMEELDNFWECTETPVVQSQAAFHYHDILLPGPCSQQLTVFIVNAIVEGDYIASVNRTFSQCVYFRMSSQYIGHKTEKQKTLTKTAKNSSSVNNILQCNVQMNIIIIRTWKQTVNSKLYPASRLSVQEFQQQLRNFIVQSHYRRIGENIGWSVADLG